MVLRKVKLGLFLVLNHSCLLIFVVPLVKALRLVSEFFVVYGCLLKLNGYLEPFIEDAWVSHIFVVDHVQCGFLI